jgi:hypothetical protein
LTPKRFLLATLFILCVVSGVGQAVAVPWSGETSKQAVFLSPLERWMPTWNLDSYVLLLERAGYHVDVLLNEGVSISFLRAGLARYDLIILRTESFSNEEVNFYCSGEPVTRQARTTFANEISSHELQVGVCVGFSLIFLQNSYPANSLRAGLVYTLGSSTEELSSAFLDAGASIFVTPEDASGYSLQWGRMDAFSIQLFRYLSRGYTMKDAMIELKAYLNTGHGESATWPSLFVRGDQDFKI